ncbi:Gfo/Idh/MocA family oxidoreductase, partial [Microbacterium sp. zg.Y909]|uniref:Gfo/Idh/MocA family oxidoreductase n=1 Tax=Microbacterium sp. zg.Y909 TaxID=2969413 RepID=UPI00214C6EF9
MIIIDTALHKREAEGRPIGVAIVGAGFMGRGLINQITHSVPGMRVSVVVNRTLEKAEAALREAGVTDVRRAATAAEVDAAVAAGAVAVTTDFRAANHAASIDAVIEA